jgi:hypothetical protein
MPERPKPYALFLIGAAFTVGVAILLILILFPPEALSVPL